MVAINKRWNGTGGTAGDLTAIANWDKVSLRNADFEWIASGSGTSEYYCRAAGGGDPGLLEPPSLYLNGLLATAGTAGSLTAGRWDYADNDALGYSTIYVRLSDSTDPDSKTTDYVQLLDKVRAGDYVRIPAGTGTMTTNLDLSATTVNSWIFDEGYTAAVGSSTNYLKLSITNTTGIFRTQATGQMYVDLGASQVAPQILDAKAASNGVLGLYFKGTGISTITADKGTAGIAALHGEKATVATIRTNGGTVIVGAGVTLTTLQQFGGKVIQRCSATTATIYAGVHHQEEAAANTTLNVEGGTSIMDSTGTNGTVNLNRGVFDGRRGTSTTLNQARAECTFRKHTNHTVGTYNAPGAPVEIAVTPL